MTTKQQSFTLRPITDSDIATCAHLAGLAFESDRHTQLKSRSQTDPYNHGAGMAGGLKHWLSRPSGEVEMTLAADASSGEILGWVVWGFRGFNSDQARIQREQDSKQWNESDERYQLHNHTTEDFKADNAKSAREKLEAFTNHDMEVWMRRLMQPGSRCMYVCSLVVHPEHQGRGIGAALIQKGTDRADAEGVFCWVHASEAGAEMFGNQGFKEVGRLELDLDEWNLENLTPPEGPTAKWGNYTLGYMRREAGAVKVS